jgi:hypothetical protein
VSDDDPLANAPTSGEYIAPGCVVSHAADGMIVYDDPYRGPSTAEERERRDAAYERLRARYGAPDESCSVTLDEVSARRFARALGDPPKPTPALRDAMARHAREVESRP